MKKSKTILTQHFLLIATLQVLILLVANLPHLDPYRQKLADSSSIPIAVFWVLALAVLLIGTQLIQRRLGSRLVEPLEELVNQTKLGAASIAFKKKSKNTEEDHLKHFIESQAFRSEELEQEVGRMEGEVERIMANSQVSPEELESLRDQLQTKEHFTQNLATQLEFEQSKGAKLEKELLQLRRDLLHRNRELDELRETSGVASGSDHSLTISSDLVENLATPLKLINNLSWRLAKSWDETTPAQIREGLEELCKQSEEPLKLLKLYPSQPEQSDRNQT